MDLKQAMQTLEERRKQLLSRIPAQAFTMRQRQLKEVVAEEVEAAQKHLEAVYRSGLEVGPNLAALEAHANHPKYAFWLEGIHRHLDECEAILAEQPESKKTGG